jgi:hypothetical protein
MRHSAVSDTGDPAAAFGAPRRPVYRRWLVVVVLAVLLRVLLVLVVESPSVRALLHVGSGYSSCVAAGISTPEGREGVCARGIGLVGQTTVYNVVDRRHVLRMPEYEARLLPGWRATSTHVTNASEHEDLYPGGHGQLVSFQVRITNTSGRPLPFGAGVGDAPRPSYPAQPLIELALPSITGSSSDTDTNYPAIVNGRGAPMPSVFRQQLIAPHESVTGWVSFVAPAWSLAVLEARPADVDFSRVNGSSSYVGQIRLWK